MYSVGGGTTTSFSVPGAGATLAEGSNKNDVIVGEYTTPNRVSMAHRPLAALAFGGAVQPGNMQMETDFAGKSKDRSERKNCSM